MNRKLTRIVALTLWGCLSAAAMPPRLSIAQQSVTDTNASIAAHRVPTQHLPNAVQVSSQVISGGLPEGEQAFAELQSLGIKTIISVDGAQPDVEMAKRFGLRYVHLPHGYNGISTERTQELAKAVRVLESPIYIHCHHGKHRSPAAAAVACIAAGQIPAADATAILELAGTSRNYQGLYRAAIAAQPIASTTLDALEVDYKSKVDPPPMVEQMIAIEHAHDHLKQFAADAWKASPKHPDLDPAHEALLLREHFTEMLRGEIERQSPEAFLESIRDSRDAAAGLEAAIRSGLPHRARQAFVNRIQANCVACHRRFRDVPLSE
ncbi:protein-tyrosine phosphatase family protein [Rosistilla carotiformis]|nr:hypothetical protein [Rosistilla carotiformis]